MTLALLAGCASDDDPEVTEDDVTEDEVPEDEAPEDEAVDGEAVSDEDGDPTNPAGAPIAIETDDLELAGLLRLPGDEGTHLGVVIAHGSGPIDRAGSMRGQLGMTLPRPVQVYEELAIGLQERGFAVLTWDKRSCGPFNSCSDNDYPAPPDDLTIDTFVGDVGAAVATLASRDDVDEVVVIGHSKGGTMAVHVAADREDVAGVVTLGTPIAPIDDVLADQAERFAELVEAAGQTGTAAADQEVEAIRQMATDVAAIRDGDLDDDLDDEPIGGASRMFWGSWLRLGDEVPDVVAGMEVPLLVLGGEHDWNVDPARIREWHPHLRDSDDLEVLGSLTHALTWLGEDDPAEMTVADLGVEVDDIVVETIAGWLDATVER